MKTPEEIINDFLQKITGDPTGGITVIDELEQEGYRIVKMSDLEVLENILYHLSRGSTNFNDLIATEWSIRIEEMKNATSSKE